jgi:hypothetical protein
MTECVSKEHQVSSTTWHSTLWQVSFMIGAGASGFLFAALEYQSYLVITALTIAAITAFIFISKKPHLNKNDERAPMLDSIKSGIKFVFSNQVFLGAISLDLFAVLFGGAVALLPIYANDILKVGPQGLGFLKAAPSLGSFLMAAVIVYYPPVKNTGKKLLWAVFGFGICMIVFGISKFAPFKPDIILPPGKERVRVVRLLCQSHFHRNHQREKLDQIYYKYSPI